MSKSDYYEHAYLLLIFNAVTLDGLAENPVVGAVTHLTVALHTANPGEAGNQATSEIVYTGYARKQVARTAAEWFVSGSNVFPINPIEFPEMTGGAGGIASYASVGDGLSDHILYSGPIVGGGINIVTGVIPRLKGLAWFASGQSSVITED